MLNTLVSLKSYVGTIIIFVLFIISFVVMVATMSVPNVKFLTIPLTISLGIALMNCVVYLNNIVKLKEDNVSETGEQVQLYTCPEYWMKDIMYRKEGSSNIPVSVCKNAYTHPEDNTKTRYVGGSTLSNQNGSSFFNNFKSTYSNDDTSLSNIDDLLNEMNVETFVNEPFTNEHTTYDGTTIRSLNYETTSNGESYIIRTDSNNTNSDRRVLYIGSSNYDSQSNGLSNIPGAHYHYISSMTRHDNDFNLPEHADLVGAEYHWHGDHDGQMGGSEVPGECLSNWICKDDTNGGLIINLEKLNEYGNENLCKHSKQFHWVEAMNKCDVVGL